MLPMGTLMLWKLETVTANAYAPDCDQAHPMFQYTIVETTGRLCSGGVNGYWERRRNAIHGRLLSVPVSESTV